MFNTSTTVGNHGPVHTLQMSGNRCVKLVPPALFSELVANPSAAGHFYRAGCTALLPRGLLLCVSDPPSVELMDRDDAWPRRLELHWLLTNHFGKLQHTAAHALPLKLLSLSYRDALPGSATNEDVLRIFTRLTQERLELAIDRCFARGELDSAAALPAGLHDPAYSHIGLFARIHASQIRWIARELERRTDAVLTVVDVGCGPGHFLIALAMHLQRRGLLDRARLIGLDAIDHDMRIGAELMAERDWTVQFLPFDLMGAHAMDQLRRIKPDFVICNHVLEHLPGPIENRRLHDLTLAALIGVSISLPFDSGPTAAISAHSSVFTPADVNALAKKIPVRCASAVSAQELCEGAEAVGLLAFRRDEPGRLFDAPRVVQPLARTRFAAPDILDDFIRPFDIGAFHKPRSAATIGRLRDRATFARIGGLPQQVRQLLIKEPGGPLLLPAAFSQFEEPLALILAHNQAFNPDHDCCFGYLNCFRGISHVDAYRGLSLQWHGDQLQGLRRDWAYKPDWTYICSSALPTTLLEQGFDLGDAQQRWELGEPVDLYSYFAAQAREACRYRSTPFEIQLLSPYIVHAASPALEPTPRVFVKIAFSTRTFWDNRELRQNAALPIDDWLAHDSVGLVGGMLSHGHWHERFVKEGIVR